MSQELSEPSDDDSLGYQCLDCVTIHWGLGDIKNCNRCAGPVKPTVWRPRPEITEQYLDAEIVRGLSELERYLERK